MALIEAPLKVRYLFTGPYLANSVQERESKVPRVRREHVRRVRVDEVEVPAHDGLAEDVEDDAGRRGVGRK